VQVFEKRHIDGAGDVSGHPVDWFHLAAKAFGSPRIQKAPIVGGAMFADKGGIDHHVRPWMRDKRSPRRGFVAGTRRPALGDPTRVTAVEHRDRVMSEPTEHPPQTTREPT